MKLSQSLFLENFFVERRFRNLLCVSQVVIGRKVKIDTVSLVTRKIPNKLRSADRNLNCKKWYRHVSVFVFLITMLSCCSICLPTL